MTGWTDADLDRLYAGTTGEPPKPKRNKFNVAPKSERMVGLLAFASKAEAEAYQKLLFMQVAGVVTKIELQPEYPFEQGWKYVADFRVTYADGSQETIDVKGVATRVFKNNVKMMKHHYPDVRLTIWK